ncbi:MAG: hypothetical protein BGO43_04360 [Gammaproteobacteria bacterium 39-13]|nr:DUF1857 family protein [Gammaproteobacteria bacterium]OJV94917.1 MAG: hypothetical protein BGO43_04360 [Gammaproteobacteria bacterium 39-13]
MLTAFNHDQEKQLARPFIHSAEFEFQVAIEKHPEQVFAKRTTDVNAVLQTHDAFKDFKDPKFDAQEVWQGLKFKAEQPHIYTIPIVAAAVIESSRRKTSYGEVFDRVSLQPSWTTNALVLVKEETHIDEKQKKVTFLGRPLDIEEAKQLLIPELISEMFDKKSEKALKILPHSMNETEALDYLSKHFEALFTKERPASFHVQHGITGYEDKPQETWVLVRLTEAPITFEEQQANLQLKEKIASSISWKLYLETLNTFERASSKPFLRNL